MQIKKYLNLDENMWISFWLVCSWSRVVLSVDASFHRTLGPTELFVLTLVSSLCEVTQ